MLPALGEILGVENFAPLPVEVTHLDRDVA
jgi:hypothetical protein